jgi:hypothetical protein
VGAAGQSEAVDGRRMMAEAAALAFPRRAGSEGDPRARALIREALAEAGLEVSEEPFAYDIRPAERALRGLLLGTALLTASAGLLALRWPAAALALQLAGMLAAVALVAWAPGLERLYRGEGPTRTANVVGRSGPQRPARTLIVLAHHDSKSQNLSFPWRIGLTLVALGAAALLLLLLALSLAGLGPGGGPGWPVLLTAGVSAAALLLLSTLKSGNLSPGGVDNAGSVAIVLELARRLPDRLPADAELIVLATGAEEDHMVGALRWLEAHAADLRGRPVHALNFDGAGAPGTTVLIERYGLGRAFAPALSRAVRRAARRLGWPVRGILMPPAMGIDAIPFAHRGLECLTVASGGLRPAILAIHSRRDVAAHLDRGAMERAALLALETLAELAIARE